MPSKMGEIARVENRPLSDESFPHCKVSLPVNASLNLATLQRRLPGPRRPNTNSMIVCSLVRLRTCSFSLWYPQEISLVRDLPFDCVIWLSWKAAFIIGKYAASGELFSSKTACVGYVFLRDDRKPIRLTGRNGIAGNAKFCIASALNQAFCGLQSPLR